MSRRAYGTWLYLSRKYVVVADEHTKKFVRSIVDMMVMVRCFQLNRFWFRDLEGGWFRSTASPFILFLRR